MVNKALWEIDQFDEALASFKSDPRSYLEMWERSADRAQPPYPRGGSLTAEEREAIAALDFGSLYAMGVNPFLLWQFARSVAVPDLMPVETLIEEFRLAAEPYGYPDFRT